MQAGNKMFSDGDLLKMGWKKTKEKIGFLIGATVVAMLSMYVPGFLLMWIGSKTDFPGMFAFLAFLAFVFMGALIGVGMIHILLGIVDGKQVALGDLYKGMDRILPYLGTSILYILIVVGGMFLLVFPGIIWSVKYCYAPLLAIDKGLGPVEALKASAELTNGIKWDILAFQGVLGYIVMIGYACLFVGLVVAIPVISLATMGLYRHLQPAGAPAPKPAVPAAS